MGKVAEIFVLKPLEVGFDIEKIQIVDYNIPQLDRIEKKMDTILELLEGRKLYSDFGLSTLKGKPYKRTYSEPVDVTVSAD